METKPKENRGRRLHIKDFFGLSDFFFFFNLWSMRMQITLSSQRYTRGPLKPSPNPSFCAVQCFLPSLPLPLSSLFQKLIKEQLHMTSGGSECCWEWRRWGTAQGLWSWRDLRMHLSLAFSCQHFDTGDSRYLRVSWQFIL